MYCTQIIGNWRTKIFRRKVTSKKFFQSCVDIYYPGVKLSKTSVYRTCVMKISGELLVCCNFTNRNNLFMIFT